MTSNEILSQETVRFASTFIRRSVLYAELEHRDGRIYHVFCTHLTPVFTTIAWPYEEGSWREEQSDQIDELRAYMDEKSGGDPAILIGDLNTGPAVGETIIAEAAAAGNYRKLEDMDNAYLDHVDDPTCTFCNGNPLVGGADDDQSVIIDHIFFDAAPEGTLEAARILDGPVDIETDDGPVTTRYSDHYGLRAVYTPAD
jgi:endonuclease/exonuclease/phosphatase family metal-dependent hydrolase